MTTRAWVHRQHQRAAGGIGERGGGAVPGELCPPIAASARPRLSFWSARVFMDQFSVGSLEIPLLGQEDQGSPLRTSCPGQRSSISWRRSPPFNCKFGLASTGTDAQV